MADVNGGGGAAAAPAPGVVTNMPAVPKDVQPKRASDLARERGQRSLGGAPAQAVPTTGKGRVGAFADKIEARQTEIREERAAKEAPPAAEPKDPNAPEETPSLTGEGAEGEGDGSELAEPKVPGKLTDAEVLAKYREWEDSSFFPEDLASKMHEVKVRGQTRYVDTNELRKGYMRHGDYVDRGKELTTKEAEVTNYRKAMDTHFEAIKNDEQFLDIYERNGYSDVLEKVADRVHARRKEQNMIVRSAGLARAQQLGFTAEEIQAGKADNHRDVVAAMQSTQAQLKRSHALEIENRKLQFERDQVKQQHDERVRQERVSQHEQVFTKQLDQLRPVALKAHGIQDSPANRKVFVRHLKEVLATEGGLPDSGFSQKIVMSAAQAMKEELEDRQLSEQDGNPGFLSPAEFKARQEAAKRQGKPLGPNRSGGGLGKPIAGQGTQAKRPSDLQREMLNRSLGRK